MTSWGLHDAGWQEVNRLTFSGWKKLFSIHIITVLFLLVPVPNVFLLTNRDGLFNAGDVSPFASLAIRFFAFMTETLKEKLARCEESWARKWKYARRRKETRSRTEPSHCIFKKNLLPYTVLNSAFCESQGRRTQCSSEDNMTKQQLVFTLVYISLISLSSGLSVLNGDVSKVSGSQVKVNKIRENWALRRYRSHSLHQLWPPAAAQLALLSLHFHLRLQTICEGTKTPARAAQRTTTGSLSICTLWHPRTSHIIDLLCVL